MNDTVIHVANLSKRYRLGVVGTGTLSHDLNRWWARVRGRPDPTLKVGQPAAGNRQLPVGGHRLPSTDAVASDVHAATSDYMWALKDVSFEVRQGEILGIIGRNGAGKSTVLKILSRVTAPTSGEVRVRGRVASLLEVGTGFHPELTGRENIFLNGAVLGMRKAEIARKFDEIVAFSEVEQYIDTPVKRYSSGMYVRLAFAVAAHLDPEILIVDEVLAVGDAEFQRKCLNRMDAIGHEGRTVLFVSHNLSSVTRLCSRVVLLDAGRITMTGAAESVVGAYLSRGIGLATSKMWDEDEAAPGTHVVRLRRVDVLTDSGVSSGVIEVKERIGIALEYAVLEPGHALVPNVHVHFQGSRAFVALDTSEEAQLRPRHPGVYRSIAWIPGNLLAEGTLTVDVAISTLRPNNAHVYVSNAVSFQVFDDLRGQSARGIYAEPMPGVVRPKLVWETHRSPLEEP